MKKFRITSHFGICLVLLLILLPTKALAVCAHIYGTDPLNPSPESPLGEYLEHTQAATVERAFPLEYNGSNGDPRLVVTVSQNSYAEFERLFMDDSILWLFHDPNARLLNVAFNGNKGFMARLNFMMEFTFSGVMLIPICLTENEAKRVKDFFNLAKGVRQNFDVALFPWLLTDSAGMPYMPSGDSTSLSEWFVRIPMGEELDDRQSRTEYNMPNINPDLHELLKSVWSTPYSHRSLGEVLDLKPFRQDRGLNTPGLIASSLLANVPSERLPAVFRFVVNHLDPLPPDFNNWFDVDFNPSNLPFTFKEYLYDENFYY